MDDRKQMTFYVSFWNAINNLNKKDQLPVFRAVISYGLFGTHEERLTVSQNAFFSLIKPVLDSARKKSLSGKQGGSKRKQSESKQEANGKQTASEKEREVEEEKEVEIEIENECYTREEGFASFWEAYPRKEGRQKALEAFAAVDAPLDILLSALAAQKKSKQWQKDDGAFIPMPANWLKDRRWEDATAPAALTARQLDEDEQEAVRRMMTQEDSDG